MLDEMGDIESILPASGFFLTEGVTPRVEAFNEGGYKSDDMPWSVPKANPFKPKQGRLFGCPMGKMLCTMLFHFSDFEMKDHFAAKREAMLNDPSRPR